MSNFPDLDRDNPNENADYLLVGSDEETTSQKLKTDATTKTQILSEYIRNILSVIEAHKFVILEWLLIIFVSTIILLGAVMLVMLVVGYIYANIEAFIVVTVIIFVFVMLIILIYNSLSLRQQSQTPPNDEQVKYQAAQRTYMNIAATMFTVFEKMAMICPLAVPQTIYDVFSSQRLRWENGIIFYSYAVMKIGPVDIQMFANVFRAELERMLYNYEGYGLLTNVKYIDGVEQPSLVAHDFREAGQYIIVEMVVNSERYQNFRRHKDISKFGLTDDKTNADDDEFL